MEMMSLEGCVGSKVLWNARAWGKKGGPLSSSGKAVLLSVPLEQEDSGDVPVIEVRGSPGHNMWLRPSLLARPQVPELSLQPHDTVTLLGKNCSPMGR